jgi:ubiquinone/menaquinone biosynthesis C-methylase UbiE
MSNSTGANLLLDTKLILSKIKVGDNMKIADLGCGTSGHFVFRLADLVGKNGTVYAVDILKNIVESINKKIKQENIGNVKAIWSDLEVFGATKIEAGSLDLALLINSLYQSKNRGAILREATRLLKKGGKLMVIEWKNFNLSFGPPTKNKVEEELLITACHKLGYNLDEEFIAGQYHYGVIFTKN